MEDQATTEVAPGSLDEALGTDGALIAEVEAELVEATQARPMPLDELAEERPEGPSLSKLDVLADVEVEVSVEFGRRRMPLRELLALRRGSLIELARKPDQQVTVLANGTEIAYGDIVLVGDQLGVHIVELASPAGAGGSAVEAVVEAARAVPDPASTGRDAMEAEAVGEGPA